MVANIQVTHVEPATTAEVVVSCRVPAPPQPGGRRDRLFVGRRTDTLRRHAATARLEALPALVLLDQNVLLAKNLTLFF